VARGPVVNRIAFPVVSEWCQKVVDYVAGSFCSIGE
jgi:hypothetical protein